MTPLEQKLTFWFTNSVVYELVFTKILFIAYELLVSNQFRLLISCFYYVPLGLFIKYCGRDKAYFALTNKDQLYSSSFV